MLKKKRIVVAKLSKIEVRTFSDFTYTRQALLQMITLLERGETKAWVELRKDHKWPEGKKVVIDHRKRELYYEDF